MRCVKSRVLGSQFMQSKMDIFLSIALKPIALIDVT